MVIGIDPGLTGAAVLAAHDTILDCIDLPTAARPDGGRVANWLDAGALDERLREWASRYGFAAHCVAAVLEQPRPMPSMPSTTSASLFDTVGAIRGVLATRAWLQVLHADPQAWKRSFRLGAGDKGASREVAMRIFPAAAGFFRRAKDHNRAEAALLARWGQLELFGDRQASVVRAQAELLAETT
jgi:crossover junction endodeoxyribonuclease RuvC